MKHTKDSALYQAASKGLIRGRRNLGLIRVSKLETSLRHFKFDVLARAVALSLCEDIPEHRGTAFIQAMNCTSIRDWSNIAVVDNNQGQLQCINFSVLRGKKRKEFIKNNLEFSQALTSQLNIISKKGKDL